MGVLQPGTPAGLLIGFGGVIEISPEKLRRAQELKKSLTPVAPATQSTTPEEPAQ